MSLNMIDLPRLKVLVRRLALDLPIRMMSCFPVAKLSVEAGSLMEHPFFQLPLHIGSSFTYRPEHFVEHAGFQKIVDHLESLQPGQFRAVSIVGAPRNGKTHFGFFALDRLLTAGFSSALRVAPDLRLLEIREAPNHPALGALDFYPPALCVDDAQNILASEELVSAFVALYEQVRQASGVIILLSDRPLQSSNPHLQSRLASLTTLQIEEPAREDVESLRLSIAKQRGLKLKTRD